MPCVCGKGFTTDLCCGRFLSGEAWPLTAEELMRSRYAAFATGNAAYLEETHDPATRVQAYDLRANPAWEGLEILDTLAGGAEDEAGIVEFKATFRARPRSYPAILHERSNFRRLEGRWYYTDGVVPQQRPVVREGIPGRNDPCSCGSGKKFKKCCGGRV